jgi:L-fucose isomerase-like protein
VKTRLPSGTCGTAACSLARRTRAPRQECTATEKIGPTLEFGCKAEPKVTVFRIGKDAEGKFRFFIASGEALDKPKQFLGTSIVVKTKNDAAKIVNDSVSAGWEPHFVVAMGDIEAELEILANMLGIKVEKF